MNIVVHALFLIALSNICARGLKHGFFLCGISLILLLTLYNQVSGNIPNTCFFLIGVGSVFCDLKSLSRDFKRNFLEKKQRNINLDIQDHTNKLPRHRVNKNKLNITMRGHDIQSGFITYSWINKHRLIHTLTILVLRSQDSWYYPLKKYSVVIFLLLADMFLFPHSTKIDYPQFGYLNQILDQPISIPTLLIVAFIVFIVGKVSESLMAIGTLNPSEKKDLYHQVISCLEQLETKRLSTYISQVQDSAFKQLELERQQQHENDARIEQQNQENTTTQQHQENRAHQSAKIQAIQERVKTMLSN